MNYDSKHGLFIHFEKASGLVRGMPAGLLTSWQEGQAFGEGSDAPWGEGEPCFKAFQLPLI